MPEISEIQKQLDKARAKTEINSRIVDNLCKEMLLQYAQDLDNLMVKVKDIVMNADDITTEEFESIAIKLPTVLYFTGSAAEYVGIRADVSKAFEKEKYANTYVNLVNGTVKEKEYIATSETQAEFIVTVVTTRTYKQLQQKLQAGYELLAAVKKILTRRMQVYDLPQ